MKHQKSCGPQWGTLVNSLLRVITFAYELRFRCTISCWKGLSKECTLCHQTKSIYYLILVRPKNIVQGLKTPEVQDSKARKNCQDEPVGIGGWPSISTWINTPPLGRKCLHFIEVPHQLRKFLLNLAMGERVALVQELPYFDDSIKLDPLLSSDLDLCVQNLIIGCLLYDVRVVTFAYDLHFRRMIARWKGLSKDYTCCHQTLTPTIV